MKKLWAIFLVGALLLPVHAGIEIHQSGSAGSSFSGTYASFGVTSGGSESAPVLYKSDDTDTGIFWSAANTLAFTTGDTTRLTLNSTGLTAGAFTPFLGRANAGSVSFGFTGDTDTGMQRTSADSIGFLAGGVNVFQMERSGSVNTASMSMGGTTTLAPLIGKANANTTAVATAGTGEDDLITYALPANALLNAGSVGKGVRITAWGTSANNANAKTVKVYFGTQLMATLALTASQAGVWKAEATVFKTGSSTQDYFAEIREVVTGTSAFKAGSGAGSASQTDTGAITIKCTGEATDNSDITQEGLLVEFIA